VLAPFSRHGELQRVNCGHPPPLRFRAGTLERLARAEPTTPLGLEPAPTIQRFTLDATDRVLLYTDGLVARLLDHAGGRLDDDLALVLAQPRL
jgi:serine phosphatase RsbU (regulator of sigma subunit)